MSFRAGVRAFACAAVAVWLCAAPAQADAPFQRGFTVIGWTAGSYLTPRSDANITRLAGDGSSHMAVFTQWFMDSPTSSAIAPDPNRTASDEAVLHALATAHAAGMSTVLKPQVSMRTGNWIGYAHPADLDQFWSDYRTMLLHYARLAEEGGASMLIVGTEMKTLSSDERRWRELIAEVRQEFHGELTYAANYDEFQQVRFWDALDYIGIDAYFGLADAGNPAPGVDALAAAWDRRGHLARIAAVSHSTGKRVLFTEIGYRGIHPTAVQPNRWDVDGDIDRDAQANAYEAFYRAVASQPWMAGVYWWGVDIDSWWVKGYTPVGKPAEGVMSAWNQRLGAEEPSVPEPAPPAAEPTPPASEQTPTPPAPTPPIASVAPVAPVAPIAPVAPAPPSATISVVLRHRRIAGAVKPFERACGGEVRLQTRSSRTALGRRMHLNASGRFSSRLKPPRVRFRAVFSSVCGRLASRWVPAQN